MKVELEQLLGERLHKLYQSPPGICNEDFIAFDNFTYLPNFCYGMQNFTAIIDWISGVEKFLSLFKAKEIIFF